MDIEHAACPKGCHVEKPNVGELFDRLGIDDDDVGSADGKRPNSEVVEGTAGAQ